MGLPLLLMSLIKSKTHPRGKSEEESLDRACLR